METRPAEQLVLQGTEIRLEPLEHHHADGLARAAAADPSLYRWSPIPQGTQQARSYIDTALAWRDAGTAVPFAIVRAKDDAVIGSTRFGIWNAGLGRRILRIMSAAPSMLARSATHG